jgi:flagellar biosynthesis protein FlhB
MVVVIGIVRVVVTTLVSVSVVVVVIAWAEPNWTSVLNAMKHTATKSKPNSILGRLFNRDSLCDSLLHSTNVVGNTWHKGNMDDTSS